MFFIPPHQVFVHMDKIPRNLLLSTLNSASSLSLSSYGRFSSLRVPSHPTSFLFLVPSLLSAPTLQPLLSLSRPRSPWLLPSYFQPWPSAPLRCCFPDPIRPMLCWTDLQSPFSLSQTFCQIFFPFCRFISFFTPFPWCQETTRLWRAQGDTPVSYSVPVSGWKLLLTVQNDSNKDLLDLLQYWSATC